MFQLLNVIQDSGDLTRSYCTATFTECETQTLIQGYTIEQFDLNLNVVTRHYHFNSFRKLDLASAVHRTQIELRTILVAERSVTATFFLLQNIDRSLEVIVRSNSSRVYDYHTALYFVLVDTAKQQTYVVSSFTFGKSLAEHFNASDDRLLVFTKTEQLNFIADLATACLDTAGGNCTTTRD